MPASTLTCNDVRGEVQTMITDTETLSSTVLDRLTNRAISEVAVAYEDPNHEQTYSGITLVASTRSYSLSAIDPLAILSVKDTTADLPLYPLSREEAENYRENETGAPAHWFCYGSDINVYPLTASAASYVGDTLRIRYIRRPAVISGTTVLPFASELDEAVVQYAAFLAFNRLNEPERAAGCLKIALAIIGSRKTRRARDYARGHHAARPYWS